MNTSRGKRFYKIHAVIASVPFITYVILAVYKYFQHYSIVDGFETYVHFTVFSPFLIYSISGILLSLTRLSSRRIACICVAITIIAISIPFVYSTVSGIMWRSIGPG